MAVKYVSDFTFAPSPPRPSIPGYARGGRVSTPQPYAKGGKVSTPQRYADGGFAVKKGLSNDAGHSGPNAKVNDAKVVRTKGVGDGDVKFGAVVKAKGTRAEVGLKKMAKGGSTTPQRYALGGLYRKSGVENDGGHSGKNAKIKDSVVVKHGGIGDGDVKRAKMSERPQAATRSLVKSAAVSKACGGRISNLGRYAHGGKVTTGKVPVKDSGAVNPADAVSPGSFKRTPPGQAASNKAQAKSTFSKPGNTKPATPQRGGNIERMSGFSDFAKGGGVNPKRNAAIHAKAKKVGPSKAGALSAILGAMPGAGGPPGMSAPPGMGGPPMGGPPGAPPGGAPMGAPPGQPMMAGGGAVRHVIVHHLSHKV